MTDRSSSFAGFDTRFASKFVEDHDLIVLGDFNTPTLTDKLFAALASRGLQIPGPRVQLKVGDCVVGGSNLARRRPLRSTPAIVPENFTNYGALAFFISNGHIDNSSPASTPPAKSSRASSATASPSGCK